MRFSRCGFRIGHTALRREQTAKSRSNSEFSKGARGDSHIAVWGWVCLWSDRFCLLEKTKILIFAVKTR